MDNNLTIKMRIDYVQLASLNKNKIEYSILLEPALIIGGEPLASGIDFISLRLSSEGSPGLGWD